MRFPRGFVDDVRNQADIYRVVSDYVTLKKRGANYQACCPFHSEKTPSFNVHPGKGIYKCFGCGAGGDVFGFIMQIEGCSYPEAIRIVAQKHGIPIPLAEESEDYKKLARDREIVHRLNEWAAEFFEQQLYDGIEGARAREYIRSRGITEQTCKRFRLGYAPESWDSLIKHLKQRGATIDEIETSGLAVLKEQGGLYDRFRGRVMFPITDSQGRVIAFGGRIMDEGEPKYLNSPETAVYTKGRNLFGLDHAKNDIRRLGFAILVEGYLDCIIPQQEGIPNVVASLGTALTESQVRLLRRYMEQPRIVVNFDPDSAGQAATLRSIEMLLAEGFKVNILRMPTDQDPDEFVREKGAESFLALLKTTEPYIEYIIDITLSQNDITRPAGKVEAINAILPHLARMRDKVLRADYADQIADRLKVDSRVIREELKRVAINRQQSLDPVRLRVAQETTQAERQLLELMLANGDIRRAIASKLGEADYADLATGSIFRAIVNLEQEGVEPDYHTLSERLETDEERALLSGLLISDLEWAGGSDFDTLFKKATEALSSLKRRQLEKRLDQIQMELGQAERESDTERVLRLYQEKTELKRRKLSLSST
ncbi:MAG TPA: DNA primase [Blastocatellia bacterium]|nr:DNA primase [Blastocatellia bacterium]